MWNSSALISLLSVLCSLVSFINQQAIAYHFGASSSLDGYFIATSVPMLLSGIIGGIFSYSLVPLLVNRRVTESISYPQFSGAVFLSFVLPITLITLLSMLLSNEIVSLLAPTISIDRHAEIVVTMRLSWLNFICATVISYLVALQNAEKKFVIPLLTTIFPYLGMLIFIFLFARTIGVLSIVFGMLVGYLIVIPILYAGIYQTFKPNIAVFKTHYPNVKKYFNRIPLILFSTLSFTVYGTSDAFWASRLGPGNLSYFGYSQRLLIALGNLVVLGPLTVLSPYLSEQAAKGNKLEFRNMLFRAVRVTIFLSAPFVLIFSVLRVSIIEILFQRGSFNIDATQGLAKILPGMLFGMVAMLAVTLILKALHALGDIVGAAIVGIIGSLLYFFVSGVLSHYMGMNGIVLAYILTWCSLLGVSIWRLGRNKIRLFLPLDTLKFVVKLVLSLLITGIFMKYFQAIIIRPVTEIGILSLTFRISLISSLALGIFLLNAGLFRISEFIFILSKLLNKSKYHLV